METEYTSLSGIRKVRFLALFRIHRFTFFWLLKVLQLPQIAEEGIQDECFFQEANFDFAKVAMAEIPFSNRMCAPGIIIIHPLRDLQKLIHKLEEEFTEIEDKKVSQQQYKLKELHSKLKSFKSEFDDVIEELPKKLLFVTGHHLVARVAQLEHLVDHYKTQYLHSQDELDKMMSLWETSRSMGEDDQSTKLEKENATYPPEKHHYSRGDFQKKKSTSEEIRSIYEMKLLELQKVSTNGDHATSFDTQLLQLKEQVEMRHGKNESFLEALDHSQKQCQSYQDEFQEKQFTWEKTLSRYEITTLELQKESINDQNTNLNGQVGQLRDQLKVKQRELENLQDALDNSQKCYQSSLDEFHEKQSDWDRTQEKLNMVILELRNVSTNINDQNTSLSAQVVQLKEQVEIKQKKIDSLEESNAISQKRWQNFQDEFQKKHSSWEKTQSKFEMKILEFQKENTNINDQNTSLDAQVVQLKDQLKLKQRDLDSLEEALEHSQKQCQSLKSEISEKQLNWEKEQSGYEVTILELQKESTVMNEQNTSLNVQVAQLNNQLKMKISELNSLQEALDHSQTLGQSSQDELQEMESNWKKTQSRYEMTIMELQKENTNINGQNTILNALVVQLKELVQMQQIKVESLQEVLSSESTCESSQDESQDDHFNCEKIQSRLKMKIMELQMVRTVIGDQHANLDDEVVQVNDQSEIQQRKIESLQEALDHTQRLCQDSQHEFQEKQSIWEKTQSQLEVTILELQKENTDINAQVVQMNNQLKMKQSKLKSLQEILDNSQKCSQSSQDEFQEKQSVWEKTQSRLKMSILDLQRVSTNINDQNIRLTTQLVRQKEYNEIQRAKIENLREALDHSLKHCHHSRIEFQEKNSTWETTQSRFENTILELQKQNKIIIDQNLSLNAQVVKLNNQLITKQCDLELQEPLGHFQNHQHSQDELQRNQSTFEKTQSSYEMKILEFQKENTNINEDSMSLNAHELKDHFKIKHCELEHLQEALHDQPKNAQINNRLVHHMCESDRKDDDLNDICASSSYHLKLRSGRLSVLLETEHHDYTNQTNNEEAGDDAWFAKQKTENLLFPAAEAEELKATAASPNEVQARGFWSFSKGLMNGAVKTGIKVICILIPEVLVIGAIALANSSSDPITLLYDCVYNLLKPYQTMDYTKSVPF